MFVKFSKINHKKEKTKENSKNRTLIRNFGITLEQYNQMLKRQNECCNICERHISKFSKSFAVDHCHKTGRIRGLLCNWCNRGLPFFKDNPKFLNNAAKHVQEDALLLLRLEQLNNEKSSQN